MRGRREEKRGEGGERASGHYAHAVIELQSLPARGLRQIKCDLSHAIDLIANKRRATRPTGVTGNKPRVGRGGFRPRSPKGQEVGPGRALSARPRASGSAGRWWRPAAARAARARAAAARSAARSAAASAAGMKRVRARVQVAVAARRLLRHVEALRHQQVQVVAGPRHRDVEQPALLLESRALPVRHVGRDAAVDDVEHVDRRSTPGPWRNGWSTGSGSPRRAAAGRARRWSPRAGRA